MRLLLNTIMLEVNRWTPDHQLTLPLSALLEPVERAGFEALEIWQHHVSRLDRDEVDDLAAQMRDLGVKAVALGAYPLLHLQGTEAEETAAELDRLVEYAAALSATTLKIFPGRLDSAQADAAARALSVERLKDLAGKLAQRGMELTMETHGGTLCDTVESTEQLLDELRGVDNAGLCFQPYTDQDTDAAIAMYDRLRPAITHVHLQNRRQADRTCTLLAAGDWTDYRRLLPHVRRSGFDGLLCLEFTEGIFPPEGEDFDPRVVIDNAARDRAFVLEMWNG